MSGEQYLTSTSSGAPTLTGQNGSMTNSGNTGVMDWLLVTKGGWTKSFTTTNAGVYVPKSGNQFPIIFNDDSAVSGAATLCVARACESATSPTSFTNGFPTVAQVANSACNWLKSATANSTARPWWAIVADQYVHFVVQSNTGAIEWHFYGDCPAFASGDSYNTLMTTRNSAGTGGGAIMGSFAANSMAGSTRFYWCRNLDGTINSSLGCGALPFGPTALGYTVAGSTYPHPITNKLNGCRPAMGDIAATTTGAGVKAQPIRGWIPLLWHALVAGTPSLINAADTYNDSAYNAGAQFQHFPANFSAGTWTTSGGTVELEIEIPTVWAPPSI